MACCIVSISTVELRSRSGQFAQRRYERGRIIEVPAHLDWTLQNQSGIGRIEADPEGIEAGAVELFCQPRDAVGPRR